MGTLATQILEELHKTGESARAQHSLRFFRTGPGEYGEGDQFLGHNVPQQRAFAKKYWREVTIADLSELLRSEWHEARLVALLMMIHRYEKGDEDIKRGIFELFVEHLDRVNNWDLVDTSAPWMGQYLLDKPEMMRSRWEKWLQSANLWHRRVAVLATFAFLHHGDVRPTLQAATTLLHDKEDLIQKAVGWLLRETGAREPKDLRKFLDEHATTMPRTMLRYAIEKFPEAERKKYLNQKKATL